MKKVYVFFADGFEEIEALASVDVLRRAGLEVEMVSVTPDEIVTGAHGVSMFCDVNIVNCDFSDAELLLLPGGMPGAATLGESEPLRKALLRQAEAGKPLAAICAAPMVLGKLGLLRGKKATCYPGFEEYLEGADYTANLVEQDANIITGKGPGAAIPFALAIVELLVGKQMRHELEAGMMIG
ncbi:MAG: DJ-1/PfpI family protein [Mediterranea massiliensis]|nr:DJ-1/PfpI family protein [Mediterranea massiliensis]